MHFPALDNLIRLLSSLPGIGQRSAARIAFHLLRSDYAIAEQLGQAIKTLHEEIHFCTLCGGLSQEKGLCSICSLPERDNGSLCVLEEANDIYAIEQTGEFRGRYHVLGGVLSPLDGVGVDDLRIAELRKRMSAENFQEIFIATNPTLEGDATARYIADLFKESQARLTRISHGLPTGSTIEYADGAALARSIRERRQME